MRFLVLSDIHGNLEALNAVLKSAPANSFDSVLVLGDLVGYGANPNEVIERIFALEPDVMIRGNHDRVACGLGNIEPFNGLAADAIRWTQNVLTTINRTRLANLPVGPVTVNEQIEVCHGAPFDEDYYLTNINDAMLALEASNHSLCLFGHTHLPTVFEQNGDNLRMTTPDFGQTLSSTSRSDRIKVASALGYLVNPGSVGQPRDGDPRAAYATLDTEAGNELVFKRVAYPISVAQQKILEAGLPEQLASRLALGH